MILNHITTFPFTMSGKKFTDSRSSDKDNYNYHYEAWYSLLCTPQKFTAVSSVKWVYHIPKISVNESINSIPKNSFSYHQPNIHNSHCPNKSEESLAVNHPGTKFLSIYKSVILKIKLSYPKCNVVTCRSYQDMHSYVKGRNCKGKRVGGLVSLQNPTEQTP